MIRVKKASLLLSALALATPAWAAEEPAGVEAMAGTLFHVGPLPVTNSMLMTWIVALGLIVLVRLAVGKPQLVPTRGQAIVENLLEYIRDIVGLIIGKRAIAAAFPLLIGLFVFILIQNWCGLPEPT